MGLLAENVVHFSRVLRTAGLPVGPDRVITAIAAVEAVGVDRRDDVRAALSAVMLDRREQQVIFDAAFDAFFRDPKLLEQMMYLLLPKIAGRGEKQRPPRANRLAEALAAPRPEEPPKPAPQTAKEEVQFETTFSFSERERLQQADFESMTADEFDCGQEAGGAGAAACQAGAPPPACAVCARHARPAQHLAAHGAQPAHAQCVLHAGATGDARAGGAARHLGLDGSVCAALPALCARAHAALPQGPHLHLRHPAHRHHALPQEPRSPMWR